MKVTITDITHEDLVNLLSTATYGSYYWGFRYGKDKSKVKVEPEDSREDIAAKILLSGGKIEMLDGYAEDALDIYSKKGYFMDGMGVYPISLEDIRKGIEDAFNSEDARHSALSFLCDDGSFDNPRAENIMQMICFGDLIYG